MKRWKVMSECKWMQKELTPAAVIRPCIGQLLSFSPDPGTLSHHSHTQPLLMAFFPACFRTAADSVLFSNSNSCFIVWGDRLSLTKPKYSNSAFSERLRIACSYKHLWNCSYCTQTFPNFRSVMQEEHTKAPTVKSTKITPSKLPNKKTAPLVRSAVTVHSKLVPEGWDVALWPHFQIKAERIWLLMFNQYTGWTLDILDHWQHRQCDVYCVCILNNFQNSFGYIIGYVMGLCSMKTCIWFLMPPWDISIQCFTHVPLWRHVLS